jgi:hypothetical protein
MRPEVTEAQLVARYKEIGLPLDVIKRIIAALAKVNGGQ